MVSLIREDEGQGIGAVLGSDVVEDFWELSVGYLLHGAVAHSEISLCVVDRPGFRDAPEAPCVFGTVVELVESLYDRGESLVS